MAGQISGIGRADYPNGDSYEGSFLAGKRDGAGKLTYAKNKDVSEGMWKAGVMVGPLPPVPEIPAAPAPEGDAAAPPTTP